MSGALSFDAVLLAGGRSSRFGSDKAFFDWRGEPLYERQLSILRSVGPRHLWLSANDEQSFDSLPEDVSVVRDEDSDLGPAGGLLSAFRASSADWILVLGVDLPLMEASFLESLKTGDIGQVPRTRFWEPLAAWYPRIEMLRLLEDSVASGMRKLQRILDQAEENGLIRERAVLEDEAVFFTNLNSSRDTGEIERLGFDREISLHRFREGSPIREEQDFVASEEPLEVQVNGRSVSVMMRTPGHDEELAIGFLYSEGVIKTASEIREMRHLTDLDRASQGNLLEVEIDGDASLDQLTRHVFTSSSCGVCGKATIDSVFQNFPPIEKGLSVSGSLLLELPEKLREAQATFDRTGGLHASALFSREGDLLLVREDVGRHNALDKVIGAGLREGLDFHEVILLVSGRISFELMQKALSVGIPVVAGISAPSSLAVQLAEESGQTLAGFLRGRGFNLYAGELSEGE